MPKTKLVLLKTELRKSKVLALIQGKVFNLKYVNDISLLYI